MAAKDRNYTKAGAVLGIPLLAGALGFLMFICPGVSHFLQYDRDCIGNGEIWRLITSHWTHWSGEHLFWDLSVFVLLLAWLMRRDPMKTGTVLGLASLIIPLGIYGLQPDLIYYRGLSGLDSTLFAFLAIKLFSTMKREGDRGGLLLGTVLLAGLCFKIAYEAVTGNAVCVANMAPDVIVVPLAHIIGAGIGLLAGLGGPGKTDPAAVEVFPV